MLLPFRDLSDGSGALMPVEDRLWSGAVHTESGCWEWQRTRARGYGYIVRDGRLKRAHRVAYELAVGPVPPGKELDHLCANKACINPAHLEAVTHRENVMRADGPSSVNARRTECRHGHPFTPENTRVLANGERACRECKRISSRARRARTSQALGRKPAPGKRTHCPRGHAYDAANTSFTKVGTRRCKACNRTWKARKAATR